MPVIHEPLGIEAVGTFQAGPEQQERLEEFTQRVGSGEFHVETTFTIPFVCIDGRVGSLIIGPNAAGGTETIFVADDLTNKATVGQDSVVGGFRKIVQKLMGKAMPVGAHTSEHHAEDGSGCGANDSLAVIYDFIDKKRTHLQSVAASLGVTIDSETLNHIADQAAARTEFSTGKEVLDAFREEAGEDSIAKLRGDHKEVVAVINKRTGTTLDRDAPEADFGPNYEAFNIDVWAFEEAARQISASEEEVTQKVAAMVLYNLATAHVLCGPNMRVIVRE